MNRQKAGQDFENYNRVFIMCSPSLSLHDINEEFSSFGDIKDTYMVKDKHTKNSKGIIYITYAKASEAALAIERMNGKVIGNSEKPIKVVLANARSEGNVREANEDEKMRRLFILVSKDKTEKDIENEFLQYGDIEFVQIVKDKETHRSRGLAYVKFTRAYNAAVALETCPSDYKAVFASLRNNQKSGGGQRDAEPPFRRRNSETGWSDMESVVSYGSRSGRPPVIPPVNFGVLPPMPAARSYARPSMLASSFDALEKLHSYPNSGVKTIEATVLAPVSKENLRRLFSMVPGLDYFEYDQYQGHITAEYNMPQLASYARDKLNGFEYPTGFKLSVWLSDTALPGMEGGLGDKLPNPAKIKEMISSLNQITSMLQQAGVVLPQGGNDLSIADRTVSMGPLEMNCTADLPPPAPMAPADSAMAKRLFIVVTESLPESVLNDLFSRFGNLISARLLSGRNHGYVKYADAESADRAIETLHLQEVYGIRIKVLEADEPTAARDRSNGREKRGHGHRDEDNAFGAEKMAKFG